MIKLDVKKIYTGSTRPLPRLKLLMPRMLTRDLPAVANLLVFLLLYYLLVSKHQAWSSRDLGLGLETSRDCI